MTTIRRLTPLLGALALGCEDPSGEPRSEEVCYDEGFDDCDHPGCASLPTCCVGETSLECCAPLSEALTTSWAGCTDVAACAPGFDLIGAPVVVDGALAAGPGSIDNGVVLATPLDIGGAAHRIAFTAANAEGCTPEDCVNYVAVGLIPELLDWTTLGRYTLAVALRPSRGDAALLSYGDVLGTWTPDPGDRRYALDIRPDGTFALLEVDADGDTLRTLVPETSSWGPLPDQLWLAVSGRADTLPPGGVPARVREVAVERGVCDLPAYAAAEPEPVIPVPADAAPLPRIDGVGRARTAADVEAVVVDAGDALYLLHPDAATGGYALGNDEPVLTVADVPGADGIDDPWLVADDAAGRWQLYVTVRAGETATIARFSGLPGFANTLDPATRVTVAEGDAAHPRLEGFTVLGDLAVARAVGAADPGGILVRLERVPDEDRWVAAGDGAVADARILGTQPEDLFAIDRDEVADPALVEVGGVLRLLYAGRRGTRWSLGTLVSVDGAHWRKPLGDEALLAGDGTGFDALTVRDPAPWADDGRVALLYVGGDGLTTAVGRATSGASHTWPVP